MGGEEGEKWGGGVTNLTSIGGFGKCIVGERGSQSINQRINQSINQSFNQSTNHLIDHLII